MTVLDQTSDQRADHAAGGATRADQQQRTPLEGDSMTLEQIAHEARAIGVFGPQATALAIMRLADAEI